MSTMMNNSGFKYTNYHPLDEFESLDENELAATIALMVSLDAVRPGTIAKVLSVISLIDGGFIMNSTINEKYADLACECQKELLGIIRHMGEMS